MIMKIADVGCPSTQVSLILSFNDFLPCAAGFQGGGKVGILFSDFHFSTAFKFFFVLLIFSLTRNSRGCGNVEISPPLRDFQGAVERVGNLLLVFQAFHSSAISTALRGSSRGAHHVGNSPLIPLHVRSSSHLALLILHAYSVSLMRLSIRSKLAKLIPALRNFSASGKDFNFSYGVA